MKIKFDAAALNKQLHLIRSLPKPGKGEATSDGMIGLGAKDAKLIVYGVSRGVWARIVIPCDVEVEGSIILPRDRFFGLLDVLKNETTLTSRANGKQADIVAQESRFVLASWIGQLPRQSVTESAIVSSIPKEPLRDQLKLSILSGELIGGGYHVQVMKTGTGAALSVMASDRLCLITTRQNLMAASPVDLIIHPQAVRGVFDVLGMAPGDITIRASHQLTQFSAELGDGASVEFGYPNAVGSFPDVTKILAASAQPNKASFAAGELLDAISRAGALADDDLPFVDLSFTETRCKLEAFNASGTAEMTIASTSNVTEEITSIIRLQIAHLKAVISKARECGSVKVTCQWGSKLPVKWSFEFDKAEGQGPKYEDIEMVFVMAPMNREAIVKKKEQTI